MARLIWTEPALQDLDRIADYISLDKPEAARKLVQRVFQRVESLVDFPELGPCPRELAGTAYRHLVIPPLRIFYRVESARIFIVYVMRGERQFQLEDIARRDAI
jgi:toxin ParE1/3/4